MYLKKFRQANTGLLYKQTRFNVLNEETEGYAKVRRHDTIEKHKFDMNQEITDLRLKRPKSAPRNLAGYAFLAP
jgi:hypothetical protein